MTHPNYYMSSAKVIFIFDVNKLFNKIISHLSIQLYINKKVMLKLSF